VWMHTQSNTTNITIKNRLKKLSGHETTNSNRLF
jgi:hypothetical protein